MTAMIDLDAVTEQFAGKRDVIALDPVTLAIPRGEMISITLIRDLHARLDCAVVIVTHDMNRARSCKPTIARRDGRIVEDVRR